ncbi:stage V sporulation protein R [Pullulanibacillus pueri]|uniref:Stage V sporulation protein R n=1 Tax=Pullulanibacillus pueri TaxID=1437324 RepID=A0A8J2ZZ99_9BACL|nr:SpoVR family protein [Pullulanibacillus pueri]MBM7683781.1 stage V sporulation protein R [Pullulanibacillus pueri]GGH87266.1 stage V sporulation protein R [Pullulanibacillus pueri]
MNETEAKALERAIEEITEIAKGVGLDFFPMRYEICPVDVIYAFGAYVMPTRFSHWSFGKQYQKMKLQYEYGLGKIYELVINSNPCYAYLLNTNSLTQNKMIAAHVLAHSDFFKNNIRFSNTRRDMVESMTVTSSRMKAYEKTYGQQEVETFIDAVLSIQEHIDPSLPTPMTQRVHSPSIESSMAYDTYEDLTFRPKKESIALPEAPVREKFPKKSEKDLLNFIGEYSQALTEWQRDIVFMLREEMLYFWPQYETKIMNEGWASYWHARIMRELDLNTDEVIEFAKLNADVIQPHGKQLNPYRLGLKIFEDIERRYDHPTEEMRRRGIKPGTGREKLFEVRELNSDQSFIRNYLTQHIVEEEDLFIYEKVEDELKVTDKDFNDIRSELLHSRINGGFPYIVVEDGDYASKGELYLKHQYEGTELDLNHLEKVLEYVHKLWGRDVHLETVIKESPVLFSCDGNKVNRKRLV